jgi:hypothetical protein
VPVILPNGEIARVRLVASASAEDAKTAKDAAIERGDLDLGRTLPARTAILRKNDEGSYDLVDVDEPGRLVPVQQTIAKEVEKLINNEHLRLYHGMHASSARGLHIASAPSSVSASAAPSTLHLLKG